MAFCSKCGVKLEEGATFCATCGEPVNEETNNSDSSSKFDLKSEFAQFNDTQDATAEFGNADISNNKAFAVLSYFGLLVLIPIFAAKNSKFAQYHANQGLVLLIVDLIVSAVFRFLDIILGISVLGAIFGVLNGLIGIFMFVLFIIGLVNAIKGRAKELPIIGKIRILK